ncbi:DUF3887 domain-containing protein [Oleiagrimonas sp.]|jgi:hypothetical protein|uniref:DUF3887 domain-containing protein n=1 Tax=Oleiagrimonas sp. TaxID=2010330 RepID=UPI00262D26C7|nr:DUF3887 domain-containing protein [Oleiagrimonas sp.]MDA3912607.1 DUF3887 domain-containing protein [Oleiagrimonas sp.]
MIRTQTLVISAAILSLAVTALPSRAAESVRSVATCKARSGQMFDALVKKDYGKARAHFGTKMRKQFSVDRIRSVWNTLNKQAGTYKSRGLATAHAEKGFLLVSTPLKFAKGPVHAAVACDSKGRIIGLRLIPTGSAR